MVIGVVSYGEGSISLDKFTRLEQYLEESTQSIIEVEPAYNELNAIERIQSNEWSIVFAPPGLAAIALSESLYTPIFALESLDSQERALIVVPANSPINNLADLSQRTIALGQPGSAAGYYLPLYDLYGLTLAEVRFAPTPKTTLEWLASGEVDAGALSAREYERYRSEFDADEFRILHTSRRIPPGLVLLSPTVDLNLQKRIEEVLQEPPSDITADAGYVPSARVPDYQPFIELVEKVRPLESRVRETPAVLTIKNAPSSPHSAPARNFAPTDAAPATLPSPTPPPAPVSLPESASPPPPESPQESGVPVESGASLESTPPKPPSPSEPAPAVPPGKDPTPTESEPPSSPPVRNPQ
jgi:phosphonate transport system substrate-binding protein